MTLDNDKTFVVIDYEKKDIYGGNKIDTNNEPRMYSISRRGFKKAAEALMAAWTNEMTMGQARQVLIDAGLKMRSYCAVD